MKLSLAVLPSCPSCHSALCFTVCGRGSACLVTYNFTRLNVQFVNGQDVHGSKWTGQHKTKANVQAAIGQSPPSYCLRPGGKEGPAPGAGAGVCPCSRNRLSRRTVEGQKPSAADTARLAERASCTLARTLLASTWGDEGRGEGAAGK